MKEIIRDLFRIAIIYMFLCPEKRKSSFLRNDFYMKYVSQNKYQQNYAFLCLCFQRSKLDILTKNAARK
jgi:hypothetical protein